jgi:hypothetical protein
LWCLLKSQRIDLEAELHNAKDRIENLINISDNTGVSAYYGTLSPGSRLSKDRVQVQRNGNTGN